MTQIYGFVGSLSVERNYSSLDICISLGCIIYSYIMDTIDNNLHCDCNNGHIFNLL